MQPYHYFDELPWSGDMPVFPFMHLQPDNSALTLESRRSTPPAAVTTIRHPRVGVKKSRRLRNR